MQVVETGVSMMGTWGMEWVMVGETVGPCSGRKCRCRIAA